MNWEPYRSRVVIWTKPRTGPNGERQVLVKGKGVRPAEGFEREWERLEPSAAPPPAETPTP